jgi:hypothetical protein
MRLSEWFPQTFVLEKISAASAAKVGIETSLGGDARDAAHRSAARIELNGCRAFSTCRL